MTQTARHQLGAEMEQCIKLCEECHHTCLETIVLLPKNCTESNVSLFSARGRERSSPVKT